MEEFRVKILVPSKSSTIWSVQTLMADSEKELKEYLTLIYEGTDTKYEII